ncbi:MAG: DUF3990 domain-containing protein [Candidatus Methanomethylophilaceae archaeon]|nr:DUF3990 domain-containing protein [Candidatus Methanomethylophilaceae archaeon]
MPDSNSHERINRSKRYILVFHGTDRTIKTEDFDFERSNRDDDFGAGAYFTTTFKAASKWAQAKKGNVVNWYLFHQGSARLDKTITINDTETTLKWINTIIEFVEESHSDNEDFIIGDTADGMAASVIYEYSRNAHRNGKTLMDLDDDTKLEMAAALNPDSFDQQIAVKTKKGLNYLEFIDSGRARNMDDNWFYVDPAFVAADVVALMTEKYGIPEDRAIVEFTKSNIFHIITEDQSMAQLPAEELLRLYEKEVKKS